MTVDWRAKDTARQSTSVLNAAVARALLRHVRRWAAPGAATSPAYWEDLIGRTGAQLVVVGAEVGHFGLGFGVPSFFWHGSRSWTPCDGLTLTWSACEADWTAMGAAMPPTRSALKATTARAWRCTFMTPRWGLRMTLRLGVRAIPVATGAPVGPPRRARVVRGVSLPLVDFRADG